MIVSAIDDPFFSEILQGIEEVAQASGYSLFMAASQRDPGREQAIVQAMSEHRVDGVIICPVQQGGAALVATNAGCVANVDALTGELANEVMYDCQQFHGGMGYMRGTPIERLWRDARILAIGGGATFADTTTLAGFGVRPAGNVDNDRDAQNDELNDLLITGAEKTYLVFVIILFAELSTQSALRVVSKVVPSTAQSVPSNL